MATIGSTFFDLIDLYKNQNPDGTTAEVIEMLMEMNGVLDDAIAIECNDGSRHKHTVRTGLPSVAWGQLYKGIPQSKSTKAQVVDVTGFVEGASTVDTRLFKNTNADEGAIRMSEAKSFIEAMNQEVASKFFYGNTASDPDQFLGLAPRFNDTTAPNGSQIILGGGVGSDNTSIWFNTWGDKQTSLLYPQGSEAGLQREDQGRQRVLDGSNNPYYVLEEVFTWNVGLAVEDWRYVSRIANIDVSLMKAGSVDLYGLLRQAYWAIHNRRVAGGQLAIYCNSDVLEALDALGTNAGASDNFIRLTPKEIQGKEVMTYRGIPLRETDAILNTEALVS